MAREGKKSKSKRSVYKHPDPNSIRSKKRANRGFKDLEHSCRKHKRAAFRSLLKRTISGTLYPAGTKAEAKSIGWTHNAGGSIKYHSS